MASISEALTIAIEHHQAGRRQAAEQIYRQILAVDPNQPDAVHLLGVIAHQAGQHDAAIEAIGHAIRLNGTVATFHNNLGEAYRAAGKLPEAIASYQRALKLQPDNAEAQNNLGSALRDQGALDEAIASFRRALKLKPHYAEAHYNLGLALKDQGKLDEAVGRFRRVLTLRPDFAAAHNSLGNVLVLQRKLPEAVASFQQAARLSPHIAAVHNNLGNALREQGQLSEAVASLQQALGLRPDDAAAHHNLGLALKDQGKLDEAVASFRRALDLKPDDADAHKDLGLAFADRGDLDEAAACYRRALSLKPGDASTHVNLCLALRDQDRLAEAMACCRRAVELNPSYAAAQLHLGEMHEDLGEMAEAQAAFRAAIALQPDFAPAHACLATLLRGKLPEADRIAIEMRVADPALNPDQRSQLSFALAHVLDARGEYGRAAELLRRANAVRLELNRGCHAYLPAEHEQLVDNLIRGFDRGFFARVAEGGLDTRRPVFIVGLPRSGTTLIEQILASHSRIHGAGELQLGRQSFEAMAAGAGRFGSPGDSVPMPNSEEIASLARRHLERLDEVDGGRTERIVDKMPSNYLYLGLLAALFPRATFIHCRRDLRDVAVSCWMNDFRKIRWTNDPQHLPSRFAQYVRVMEHWRSVLSVPIHEVDYEEAVADLEPVARRLVAACGLDWEPACLEFDRTRRPIRTASRTQVRQPIYTQSVARWKNYEHELADLFAGLPGE